MIQVAPIPPTAHIREFDKYQYQFCLVQEAQKNPEYAEAYRFYGQSPDHYLIMDNGAFELGSSLAQEAVEWGIVNIMPNEVVLPDRMFMADETIRMSKEALKVLRPVVGVKFQGVVHGLNHKEWLDCAYALFDMGVDVLAIPKDYDAWPGGREVLLAMVEKIGLPVHFIGANRLFELTYIRNKELVRSIDSVKPCTFALENLAWATSNQKVGRSLDYFERVMNANQLSLANRNLEDWSRIANATITNN